MAIHYIEHCVTLTERPTLAHALQIYEQTICARRRGSYGHYLMAQSISEGMQLESHGGGDYVLAPIVLAPVTVPYEKLESTRLGGEDILEKRGEHQTGNIDRRDEWSRKLLLHSKEGVRKRAARLPLDSLVALRKAQDRPAGEYQDLQLRLACKRGIYSMRAWGTDKELKLLTRKLAEILPYDMTDIQPHDCY